MFKKLTIFSLLTVLALSLTACAPVEGGESYDEFAQCLTDEGMTLYGAFWCGHCADQKKLFGTAMDYIDYVECDPRGDDGQPDLCLEEGIEGYPTWKNTDGRSWVGSQSLETLGEITGCPVPSTEEATE